MSKHTGVAGTGPGLATLRRITSRRALVQVPARAALAALRAGRRGAGRRRRWWLGEWQFDRLEDRKADNAVVRANEEQAPGPGRARARPRRRGRRGRRVAGRHRDRHLRPRGHRDRALPHPRRAPPASTWWCRWSPTPAPRCWSTAAGWPPGPPARHAADDVPEPPAGEVDGHRLGARRRQRRQHRRQGPVRPARSAAQRIGAAIEPRGVRRLRRPALRGPGAGDRRWSPSSCPSSTTARTSSTACSGGSSACWPSAASATWPATSASRPAPAAYDVARGHRRRDAGRPAGLSPTTGGVPAIAGRHASAADVLSG